MAERKSVRIMQGTWLRWTKATPASLDAGPRLAVPRVHLLPQLANEGTLRHEVAAMEPDGFELLQRVRAIDDWNARFRSSIGGSNRSCFFEEHTVWVALLESPLDKALLELTPRKHIDLRTHID